MAHSGGGRVQRAARAHGTWAKASRGYSGHPTEAQAKKGAAEKGAAEKGAAAPVPAPPTSHQKRIALAETWLGRNGEARTRLAEDWEARRHAQGDPSGGPVAGGPRRPADCPPTKGNLQLHMGLHKAQSAILTQIRTGHIGLPA